LLDICDTQAGTSPLSTNTQSVDSSDVKTININVMSPAKPPGKDIMALPTVGNGYSALLDKMGKDTHSSRGMPVISPADHVLLGDKIA
jgi:hypothetical protein